VIHKAPEGMPEFCIRTISGVYIDLLNPNKKDIYAEDIAISLAHLNRFNGHTYTPYSVAEHSIAVCRQLLRRTQDKELALAGLLHDAPEAYLGDITGLLKQHPMFDAYRELEAKWARTIETLFSLLYPLDDPQIKAVDKEMFEWESAAIRDASFRVPPNPRKVAAEFTSIALALGGTR
jgi:uncharacterized protein